MRKIIIQICIILIPFSASWSQENGRISLSANFGLNGSFFVRSYPENGPGIEFYKKNFIGTSGGAELKYRLNNRSFISVGYMQSENKKEVDFYGINNGISLDIISFNIRHNEHIFYGGYERSLFKRNPGLKIQGGIYYVVPVQQEIELIGNSINIWERSKDFGFEELGVFIGFQYSRKIDTHFELGIQSRLFYEFTSNIFSQVTLNPTLTYHFSKPKNKKHSTL
jgi:hypothetical protein